MMVSGINGCQAGLFKAAHFFYCRRVAKGIKPMFVFIFVVVVVVGGFPMVILCICAAHAGYCTGCHKRTLLDENAERIQKL